jgi:hypothetical protein
LLDQRLEKLGKRVHRREERRVDPAGADRIDADVVRGAVQPFAIPSELSDWSPPVAALRLPEPVSCLGFSHDYEVTVTDLGGHASLVASASIVVTGTSILESPEHTAELGADLDRAALARFADVRGIRIEDDVLVTSTGHEVLTAAIPKERVAVQAAMQ